MDGAQAGHKPWGGMEGRGTRILIYKSSRSGAEERWDETFAFFPCCLSALLWVFSFRRFVVPLLWQPASSHPTLSTPSDLFFCVLGALFSGGKAGVTGRGGAESGGAFFSWERLPSSICEICAFLFFLLTAPALLSR